MATDGTHNGWRNYETWRVNLEICDDYVSSLDLCCKQSPDYQEPYEFSKSLESFAEEIVIGDGEGLAFDYASAFLSDVDYYQIATSQLSDIPERCEEHPVTCDDCGEVLTLEEDVNTGLCEECRETPEDLAIESDCAGCGAGITVSDNMKYAGYCAGCFKTR